MKAFTNFGREKNFLDGKGRVIIDRGIFDNYAFAMHYNLAGTETLSLINEALEGIDLNKRYAAVFYILPYQDDFTPTNTEIRRENLKEVGELQAGIYAIYSRHKNFIPIPGNMSAEKRADYILEQISKIEGKN
jgi:predicted ATPase